jgi:hypothetical protein
MIMLLSLQEILSASFKYKDVLVPEWGGEVRVRVMSGLARERFERIQSDAAKNGQKIDNLRERIMIATVCDELGNPLLSEEHIAILSTKDWTSLDEVFVAGLELNGMLSNSVDDAEKNSEAVQNGSSISG